MLLIRSVDAPFPVMLVPFGSRTQATFGVGSPLAAHSRIRSPPSGTTFAAGGTLVKLAGSTRKKGTGIFLQEAKNCQFDHKMARWDLIPGNSR